MSKVPLQPKYLGFRVQGYESYTNEPAARIQLESLLESGEGEAGFGDGCIAPGFTSGRKRPTCSRNCTYHRS